MHLLFSWCAVMLLAARATAGDAVSYVVLNDSPVNSLVRISADSQTVTTIAHGAGGLGLAVDSKGDYIVAAVSKLLRVTPSGAVNIIANTPSGSAWISVTTETSGNFLVVDNQRHALWRVTADGAIVERISFYPARPDELDSAKIIPDGAGGYLLSNENHGGHLFRVNDAGFAAEIPLRGFPRPGGGQIILDGAGKYLVSSRPSEIFRVAPNGAAELFAKLPGANACGLARNPDTGEIVVTLNFARVLVRVSPDGKRVETIVSDPRYLLYPVDVIAEKR